MLIPRVHRRQYLFTLALLALAFMGKAIVSFCQDDDAEVLRHFEAAHRAQNAGRYDVATREYSTVIRLRPQIAEAYASLGLVLNATGNFAESARVLEKADRLSPACLVFHSISVSITSRTSILNRLSLVWKMQFESSPRIASLGFGSALLS